MENNNAKESQEEPYKLINVCNDCDDSGQL